MSEEIKQRYIAQTLFKEQRTEQGLPSQATEAGQQFRGKIEYDQRQLNTHAAHAGGGSVPGASRQALFQQDNREIEANRSMAKNGSVAAQQWCKAVGVDY